MIKTKKLIDEYLKKINEDTIKTVLDLGCGAGRIFLRFARRDVNITGVDNKDIQISQNNFNFVKEDIREFEFKKKYDLIIASFILHFLKKEEAIEIIKKIKENTKDAGFNFLICMSNQDDCSKEKPENFYPNLNSLKKFYSDWALIKYDQDFTGIEEHNNLRLHRHNVILLIAKNL